MSAVVFAQTPFTGFQVVAVVFINIFFYSFQGLKSLAVLYGAAGNVKSLVHLHPLLTFNSAIYPL